MITFIGKVFLVGFMLYMGIIAGGLWFLFAVFCSGVVVAS